MAEGGFAFRVVAAPHIGKPQKRLHATLFFQHLGQARAGVLAQRLVALLEHLQTPDAIMRDRQIGIGRALNIDLIALLPLRKGFGIGA